MMDSKPPDPTFRDGISKGDLPYRIYSLPTATWLYVEQFTTFANVSAFCKAAGGVLSSPKGLEEQQQVAAFLRQTLATNVQHRPTWQADFLMWGSSSDLQVVSFDTIVNWQQADDSTTVVRQCSALGWSWDGAFSLQAYPCGLADDSLAALCRLPPAASSDSLNLPTGKTTWHHVLRIQPFNDHSQCAEFAGWHCESLLQALYAIHTMLSLSFVASFVASSIMITAV